MSAKKRNAEQANNAASTAAAVKASIQEEEEAFISANIEEKSVLCDLDELSGTVLSVRDAGGITEFANSDKVVYRLFAHDANHKLVIIEGWGPKNAAFLDALFG
jgi:hypothetical protein